MCSLNWLDQPGYSFQAPKQSQVNTTKQNRSQLYAKSKLGSIETPAVRA